MATIEQVLIHWFGDLRTLKDYPANHAKMWFTKSDQTDQDLRRMFAEDVELASRGRPREWQESPRGMLALILLLDQFSRNIWRGQARAFAQDSLALSYCKKGLSLKWDRELAHIQRVFFYLPLEHAESLADQDRCVGLFEKLLSEVPKAQEPHYRSFLAYAEKHREVIARFGRFPHRNAILKRSSTAEEMAFLAIPGSSF